MGNNSGRESDGMFGVFDFIKILGGIIILLGIMASTILVVGFAYDPSAFNETWDYYYLTIAIAVFLQMLVLGTFLLAFGKLGTLVEEFIWDWKDSKEPETEKEA